MTDTHAGYLFSLSESLGVAESNFPSLLVPVTDGLMIVVSDYPGQQKEASHEGFSSQLTKPLKEWLPTLGAFRERWLPDNRRMSFEKLSEPARWRALPAFLERAGKLRGNLVTILIDRRMGSFKHGGPGELNILRKADAAFREEIRNAGLYDAIWQRRDRRMSSRENRAPRNGSALVGARI